MATLIPAFSSCRSRMQAGEKRFAQRIDTHLPDEWICWYDLPVGIRVRYSDFILLHPQHGLLFLEVKDWRPTTIHSIDKASATIQTATGLKTVRNPFEQVRQCTHRLAQQLEGDPLLVHHSGLYQGRLLFSYAYGLVLSHITRKDFHALELERVFPPQLTICRDEMTERIDPESFQQRLRRMFEAKPARRLTREQIDRIRYHVFPEIRIEPEQLPLFLQEPQEPDIVKILDIQQEQLARSLGDGHRVIHGVAGSGKTLILIYRCLYLAQLLDQPILVLCYNITLAAWLREKLTSMASTYRLRTAIHVHHFHGWCREQLRTHRLTCPFGDRSYDLLVDTVRDAVEAGIIPQAQYGAVLIDEGHDFEPDWLRLALRMLNPETHSLLLLYDDAQSIYRTRRPLGFTLSSVGIHARGRTTILKWNYRNTDEILTVSSRFLNDYLFLHDLDDEEIPIMKPQSVGRRGPPPDIKLFASFDEEARAIAETLCRLHHEQGLAWADMSVIYRYDWIGKKLQQSLKRVGIPCDWLRRAQDKISFRPSRESVKLLTMHSSKGLEFPVVVVAGLGYVPSKEEDLVTEAKLLYVAMTRSTDSLLLTGHQETEFLRKLRTAALESDVSAAIAREMADSFI
ncbi:MAG: DNA helicase II [Nitrospirae bacterium]|nr:MAG: DNA helicase II [Nitrospirota bacterium]